MSINNNFSQINNLDDLQQFVESCAPQIRKRGGRVFIVDSQNIKLNHILQKLQKLAKDPENETVKEIAREIRALDHKKITYKNAFVKASTKTRQFFGNLFYDREKILDQLQFPGKDPVTARGGYRYLPLKGEAGSVGCRVYGQCKKTIPRLSPNQRVECSARTIARLKNLIAVRGAKLGARMIGPCAYYGNLEKPHKYDFSIDIDDYGVPTFFRHKRQPISQTSERNQQEDFTGKSIEINALWHKGTGENIQDVQEKYANDQPNVLGASLFPNSGILEVDQDKIDLPYFDATQVDLSSFKAELVKNDVPFSIVNTKVSAKDEFRPVSYFFDENYGHEQILEGGGLFLETHDFPQTMTPLDETASGFVVLGKWKMDESKKLELVGVNIPFGYTLIIKKGCIHGDTTLTGFYVMAMTSNHETMKTADTVFIKDQNNLKNFLITMEEMPEKVNAISRIPPPLSRFNKNDDKSYRKNLKSGGIPILNPFK